MKAEILATLFNAVFLLLALGAVAWEAVQRLASPQPVAVKTVMIVAGVGIVINGVTAWLFASGAKSDINIRGAFLHMAADAMSDKSSKRAAIQSWADFVNFEYGSAWTSWARSGSKSISCTQAGSRNWGCDASARPCRP